MTPARNPILRAGAAVACTAPRRLGNNGMVIERYEESLGPLAAHGFTCTAVARISRFSLPGRAGGIAWVYARPAHLEVVGPDGRHQTVVIRDVGRLATRAIQAVIAAVIVGAWLSRRTR